MTPLVRKLALTAHVVSSVGWLGAVCAFLVLALLGLTSNDPDVVRSSYIALELIAWFVIVPLCAAALLTGIVQSLGTTWGLLRHYWVLVKLLLTVLATIVLVLQLDAISFLGQQAADALLSDADYRGARGSLIVHAAGGLVVLLATTVLAIYKPAGRTRYGWRKQEELQRASPSGTP